MSTRITSESQLANQLITPLKQATQYVVDKILETNQEQVEKIVYNAYNPIVYERQKDLLNSWKAETTQYGSSAIFGSFEYDESQITATSVVTGEVVPYLADIVYNGLAGHIFGEGPWTKKRDAWAALEKEVGANKIRQWMKEGMSATGLNFKSHGGAIRA